MGLFGKRQSSITIAPGAVNLDVMARNTTGPVDMAAAKRALRLTEDQTIFEDGIWRIRSKDCNKLQGDDYWIGTLRPKGRGVAVYVGNKAVGSIEPRSIESAKSMIKEHGGRQAVCVISNTAPGSWNVYVDMR